MERIVIEPPFGSPIIADPTTLSPHECLDNKFHLFAHSIWGIHHYVSDDGISFQHLKFIKRFAIRPFVFKKGNEFYLFYEKLKFIIPFTKICFSEIQVMSSADLLSWTKSKTIFKPRLRWQGTSINNPCVVETHGGFKLYYNANLKYLWDCLFPEPEYSGVAYSKDVDNVYKNLTDKPNEKVHHVIRVRDKFTFETKWYKDKKGKVRSEIFLDGKEFIVPTRGWKKTFVYVCDEEKVGDKMYVYFNARDGWFWGKERIGLKIV